MRLFQNKSMRQSQNKSMRQSHCFYYYMDGMFLSECISKSFLEIRVSQREKCKQIYHQFR